jgi:hypothetical protein
MSKHQRLSAAIKTDPIGSLQNCVYQISDIRKNPNEAGTACCTNKLRDRFCSKRTFPEGRLVLCRENISLNQREEALFSTSLSVDNYREKNFKRRCQTINERTRLYTMATTSLIILIDPTAQNSTNLPILF